MAASPDHITITVDEEALRKQIQGIVQSELKEASLRLRRAADMLDPSFLTQQIAWIEQDVRAKIEAEQAKAREKGETK